MDGSERYYAKRKAGLSDRRRDGSITNPHTDRQSAAAEKFICELFRQPFNSNVYKNHGDGGLDFRLLKYTVEVIHLGMINNFTQPRLAGNLIVNPHEPWRWADIYISVRGSIETKFETLGWVPHKELTERPMRNFGYGDRFWWPIDELNSIDPLLQAFFGGTNEQ